MGATERGYDKGLTETGMGAKEKIKVLAFFTFLIVAAVLILVAPGR